MFSYLHENCGGEVVLLNDMKNHWGHCERCDQMIEDEEIKPNYAIISAQDENAICHRLGLG